ncbi:phosphatidylserine decarboxylase proenzyme [Escherichia coli]|nr:phosphatidylserine decarboxylase proenzyme [Escherichia coli]
MKEAQKPDTASYRTFNEFFVRPLRDEVRPIDTDPNVLVMPADGVISQLGKIEEDKILQAKGHNYSLEALLAGKLSDGGPVPQRYVCDHLPLPA